MCSVNGFFVNHGGHREHRGNTFYTNLLQLSVSSVFSVVLIGLPRGNNRALWLQGSDSEVELYWFPFIIRGDDFAVTKDGTRFLVLTSQNHVNRFNETSELAPVHLKMISNWFEEIK